MRGKMMLAALIGTAVAVAGVGTATGASPAGSSANPVRATTSPTRGFAPRTITVAPGAIVHFTNVDRARHSAIEDAIFGKPAFTSGRPTRSAFSFTAPLKAGTYSYICAVHGFMRGTLIVRR